MCDIHKYMHKAIELASCNARTAAGGPFGAIIVKDGEVISEASNSVTTDKDPTAHAEVNAIREACKKLDTFDLTGCILYTSCEPCPMCLSAAYWAHIDKIYFASDRNAAEKAGFNDSFIYDQLNLPLGKRSIPIEQVLENEGNEPFKIWLKNSVRIPY